MEEAVFREKNVSKAYIQLSLPLVLSMLVTLIYNLADTFFVAQTNDTNIVAGVSLGMPVFTFLMAVGNIFGQGGSSFISRMIGEGKVNSARRVSAFCFYAAIGVGILLGAGMIAFQDVILQMLGARKDTFFHASLYYYYLTLGAPVLVLSFIHSNFLRAEGRSKSSMVGTILGAVVNIILDPIFISYLGWGAGGAAIATVIGYFCSDIFFAVVVWRSSSMLSIHFRESRPSKKELSQVLGIGIPAAIVNVMQSASVIFLNQFLLFYGNEKIAAMGIVLKINMIALLILTGFAFGGQPLFGYYYGANDRKRLVELFRFTVKFMLALSILLTLFIFCLAPSFIRIFIHQQNIVADGSQMLRFQVATTVFVSLILLITIIFQSTGKIRGAFLLSVSRQGVLFVLVLMIAYHLLGYMGILLSQAISDLLTATMAVALFYKEFVKEWK